MSQSPDTKELQARLGMSRSSRARRIGRWAVALLVLAALAAGAFKLRASRGAPPAQYRTEAIESGTLTVSVTATGELKALTQVNIGTEISGIVESVAVDYNSPVRVGQILAASTPRSSTRRRRRLGPGCNRRKPNVCSRRPRWPRRRPSSPSFSMYAS